MVGFPALRAGTGVEFDVQGVGASVGVTVGHAGMTFWGGLEAGWGIVGAACYACWRLREFRIAVAVVCAVICYSASTLLVLDLSRSMAYIFPVVGFSVAVLARVMEPAELRRGLALVAAINLIAPNHEIIASVYVRTMEPLWQELLILGLSRFAQ